MSGLAIRPLRAEDRAAWDALWRAYLAFYETKLPEAVYDSTFARLLGDDPQDFNQTARQLYDRIASKTPFIKYAR